MVRSPGWGPGLQALGAIETMTFVSAQDTPEGKVETYSVKFASGQTMNWFIGQERDGKFSVVRRRRLGPWSQAALRRWRWLD